MISFFSLYKGHLKSSKKIILFSCIGLIVALTLISSSLYFIDNSTQEVLDNYLSQNSSGNDIQFNILSRNLVINATPSIETINESLNNVTSTYHFDFINKSATTITPAFTNFHTNSSQFFNGPAYLPTFLPVSVYQMTPEIKNELQKIHLDQYGSNITIQAAEASNSSGQQAFVLFNGLNYYSNNQQPVSNMPNGQFTFYTPSHCGFAACDIQFQLKMTGYEPLESYFYSPYQNINLFNSKSQFNYPKIFALGSMMGSPNVMIFVSNFTQFANVVQQTSFVSPIQTQSSFTVTLAFDYSKLDLVNINAMLEKQTLFAGTLISDLNYKGFSAITVIYHSSALFTYVHDQIQNLINQIIFIDLPSLIISLFLAHYIFSLIYKNIVRNISIYKTRGSTGWVILFFQTIDVFIVLIISILTALLLGVPLTLLSLKSDYLLSFNHNLPQQFIFNFQSVAMTIVYFAIILEIIVNLNRIRKLSTMTIAETDNPQETYANIDPSWKRHYIDVALIIYSIATYFIYNYMVSNSGLYESLRPVLPIISTLMVPSPLVFVIGSILFLSRIIPIFLDRVGTFLWNRTGNLTALSFKNIIRYKNTTLRAVLIVASIIAFLTFFYSQPYSMLQTYQQQTYYQSGADGVAVFKYNQIYPSAINELTNNANYSAYIDSVCSYVYLYGFTNLHEQLNFLLVNTSTYLQTAYLNYNLGLKNTLQADMNAITLTNFTNFNQLTAINILVDKGTLNQRSASIGSTISVSGSASQRFTIVDTFSRWPALSPEAEALNIPGLNSFNAIGDINYFLKDLHGSTAGSLFGGVLETGVFIKFKDLTSDQLLNVTNKIQENTPFVFKSVPKLEYQNNKQNFSFLAIGGVNLNILVAFAIIIIVILLFIQLQLIERKKEIYTERAMGMKLTQLAYMFYIENIVILGFSIIIGTIIGLVFIQLITIFSFNTNQTNLFKVVYFPINTLIQTDIIILSLSLLFSFIPTINIFKQNISNAFTGEM